jgi:hypothetical protein
MVRTEAPAQEAPNELYGSAQAAESDGKAGAMTLEARLRKLEANDARLEANIARVEANYARLKAENAALKIQLDEETAAQLRRCTEVMDQIQSMEELKGREAREHLTQDLPVRRNHTHSAEPKRRSPQYYRDHDFVGWTRSSSALDTSHAISGSQPSETFYNGNAVGATLHKSNAMSLSQASGSFSAVSKTDLKNAQLSLAFALGSDVAKLITGHKSSTQTLKAIVKTSLAGIGGIVQLSNPPLGMTIILLTDLLCFIPDFCPPTSQASSQDMLMKEVAEMINSALLKEKLQTARDRFTALTESCEWTISILDQAADSQYNDVRIAWYLGVLKDLTSLDMTIFYDCETNPTGSDCVTLQKSGVITVQAFMLQFLLIVKITVAELASELENGISQSILADLGRLTPLVTSSSKGYYDYLKDESITWSGQSLSIDSTDYCSGEPPRRRNTRRRWYYYCQFTVHAFGQAPAEDILIGRRRIGTRTPHARRRSVYISHRRRDGNYDWLYFCGGGSENYHTFINMDDPIGNGKTSCIHSGSWHSHMEQLVNKQRGFYSDAFIEDIMLPLNEFMEPITASVNIDWDLTHVGMSVPQTTGIQAASQPGWYMTDFDQQRSCTAVCVAHGLICSDDSSMIDSETKISSVASPMGLSCSSMAGPYSGPNSPSITVSTRRRDFSSIFSASGTCSSKSAGAGMHCDAEMGSEIRKFCFCQAIPCTSTNGHGASATYPCGCGSATCSNGEYCRSSVPACVEDGISNGYTFAAFGANICPNGSSIITSQTECSAAAHAIGGLSWNGVESNAANPSACYAHDQAHVRFNAHPAGKGNPYRRPLCALVAWCEPEFYSGKGTNLPSYGQACGSWYGAFTAAKNKCLSDTTCAGIYDFGGDADGVTGASNVIPAWRSCSAKPQGNQDVEQWISKPGTCT